MPHRVRGHGDSDPRLFVSLPPSSLWAQGFSGLPVHLSLLVAVTSQATLEGPAQHGSSPPPLFDFFILFCILGFTRQVLKVIGTHSISISITWNLSERPVSGPSRDLLIRSSGLGSCSDARANLGTTDPAGHFHTLLHSRSADTIPPHSWPLLPSFPPSRIGSCCWA